MKSKKGIKDLLLLGNPKLYERSVEIKNEELEEAKEWVDDLQFVMEDVRSKYGFGRGIAAPQIGIMKRLIYLNVEKPLIIINPVVINLSDDKFELWDDCMCFPNLLVKVSRHRSLKLRYKDLDWKDHECNYKDEMSELIQHEFDHLEGILCTMRAIDNKSFKWKN